MSDFDSAGTSGAGGSADSAGASGAGGFDTTSSTVQEFKDRAWEAIANSKTEDATDYVEESKDRAAEAAGDPAVNTPHRKQARAERYQRALQAAEGGNERGGQSDASTRYDSPEPSQADYEADLRARDEITRASAQHEMRVAEFVKQNPDYHDWVQ